MVRTWHNQYEIVHCIYQITVLKSLEGEFQGEVQFVEFECYAIDQKLV